MPTYEVMTIVGARTGIDHLTGLVKKISTDVIGGGGVVRGVDHLGLRPLAYRMRSHKKYHTIGRYVRFTFQTSPQMLNHVTALLRQDNNIVKYLVSKHSEIVPKQIHRPRQAFYEPLYDNGGFDMLTRGSELDLRVAAMLIQRGLCTPEELNALPKHRALDKPVRTPSTAALLSKLRKEYQDKLDDGNLTRLPGFIVPEGSEASTTEDVQALIRQRDFMRYSQVAKEESIIRKVAEARGVDVPSAERGADIFGLYGANRENVHTQSVDQFLQMFRRVKEEAAVEEQMADEAAKAAGSSDGLADRADIRKSNE